MHMVCSCGKGYVFSNVYPTNMSVSYEDCSDDVCIEEISLRHETPAPVPLYSTRKYAMGRGYETITLEGLRGPTADVLKEWYDHVMRRMTMCPHEEFIILLYVRGIMIRQCKQCKQIEMKMEGWVSVKELSETFGFELIEGIAEKHPDIAKALAKPSKKGAYWPENDDTFRD